MTSSASEQYAVSLTPLIASLYGDTFAPFALSQGVGHTPTHAAAAAGGLSPATTPTAAGAAGAETSPKRSKRQRLERLLRGRTRRTSERRHASLSLPPSPGLLNCDIDAQQQLQPSMSPVARDASSLSPVPAAALTGAAQLSASVGGAVTPQQSPVNTGSRSARGNYRHSSKQQQPSPGPLSRLSLRSASPPRERDSSAAAAGTSTLMTTRRRGSDLFSSDGGGGCDDDVDMQMMISSVPVPIAGEAAKLSRRRRLRNFLTAKGYRSRPKKVKRGKNGRRFSLVSTLPLLYLYILYSACAIGLFVQALIEHAVDAVVSDV
jgi:hypothetical protein